MLHDWDDDHAARILTALGHGATSDTRLRIFEMLVPTDTTPHRAKLSDVPMLLLFDGARERALGQYRDLLEGTGWRLEQVVATRADERHRSQPVSDRVTGSPGRWLQATKELVAGPGGDRVGRAGRGGSTRPEGGVGAMDEGGYLLELFGSDLVAHQRSPAWNRGSILPTALHVHPSS